MKISTAICGTGLFIVTLVFLSGCGPGAAGSARVTPADSLAANDPNTKAKALLDEFFTLPEGEREDWVRSKGFEFSVFESATDPQLRGQYDQYVRPLLGR